MSKDEGTRKIQNPKSKIQPPPLWRALARRGRSIKLETSTAQKDNRRKRSERSDLPRTAFIDLSRNAGPSVINPNVKCPNSKGSQNTKRQEKERKRRKCFTTKYTEHAEENFTAKYAKYTKYTNRSTRKHSQPRI